MCAAMKLCLIIYYSRSLCGKKKVKFLLRIFFFGLSASRDLSVKCSKCLAQTRGGCQLGVDFRNARQEGAVLQPWTYNGGQHASEV